jgi:hypothetical protein
MAISNHTLGDITIKSIIENPSDISYNKYPKKSKISIKQQTTTIVLFQRLFVGNKKISCSFL